MSGLGPPRLVGSNFNTPCPALVEFGTVGAEDNKGAKSMANVSSISGSEGGIVRVCGGL
jgi:hypothetical protein